MRLRTQLTLAFLLLAVLPLAWVTLYSYNSSLRAFQRVAQAEADDLTDEMESRMETVTADLRRRIDRLSGLPHWAVSGPDLKGTVQDAAALQSALLAEMGESARFLEKIEFGPPRTEEEGDSGAVPPAGQEAGAHGPAAIEIQLSPDLSGAEAGARIDADEAARFVVVSEDGKLVLRRRPATATAPEPGGESGPEAAASPEPVEGLDFAKGIESLARELEERDRLRRAGVDVPAAREEELRQKLAREIGGEIPAGTVERFGTVRAQISSREVLRQVMSRTRGERGEIPFALDKAGNLYTPDPADRPELEELQLDQAVLQGGVSASGGLVGDWVTVFREDPNSGLYFGIARPVGGSLQQIRNAAVRNLAYGLGIMGLALLGILPLSARMTRNLGRLAEGAQRLAKGDLTVRVPVRSRDEFGSLAETFNQMAQDLGESQQRLVEQERLRKEVEIGRKIQRDLLPRHALELPFAEVKGLSIPAREVGGDFFNYFLLPGRKVAVLVGDVSGKGVPAALLMANIQATLRARLPLENSLGDLAERVDAEVEATTPSEVYVTLFVGIVDPEGRVLHYVNAGHNPPFVLQAGGEMKRLDPTGRPIGLMAGGSFAVGSVELGSGGILFLYTDGLTEAEDRAGEPFGTERLESILRRERGSRLDDLLAEVEEAARRHRGDQEPADDATLLVFRTGA